MTLIRGLGRSSGGGREDALRPVRHQSSGPRVAFCRCRSPSWWGVTDTRRPGPASRSWKTTQCEGFLQVRQGSFESTKSWLNQNSNSIPQRNEMGGCTRNAEADKYYHRTGTWRRSQCGDRWSWITTSQSTSFPSSPFEVTSLRPKPSHRPSKGQGTFKMKPFP